MAVRHFLFVMTSWVTSVLSAHASGLEALDQFIQSTQNGRADFVQTVTSPSSSNVRGDAANAKSSKTKLSHGTFEFLRPNRFKFVYTQPFAQTIVADGQTLWLWDVDLNQVTSRKLASVMAGSPAAIFASAPNLQALQAQFDLQSAPSKVADDLQWVLATSKKNQQESGLLQSVKVGFRKTVSGVEIAVLEMVDSFGQTSRIAFDKVQINIKLTPSDFSFKPPVGADVLKQ